MSLRPADQDVLDHLGRPYAVGVEGGFVTVVVRDFPMPAGLEPATSDLLLLLPPGFPDAGPDMFWLDPPVQVAGGSAVPGTDGRGTYVGRVWQRWSRHIGNAWRPGIDQLATYLAYVRRCLDQAAGRAA